MSPFAREAASSLPDEIWHLILAWCGLRTSAAAAACSSAFRSLHRIVASTPALLARALLEDHGLAGAAASLYGSPAGHPHERHAVRSDADVAATLRCIVVLSAPPGVAAAANAVANAAAAAAATVIAAEAGAMDGVAMSAASTSSLAAALGATTQSVSPIGWGSGGATAFSQLVGGLLCAAASAGHVQVAATALALGAVQRDRALVAAAAAGRRRAVWLLLAGGADPDAAELFGPCALHEAARHGCTDIVELLLDAGARVDGAPAAATAALPYGDRLASLLPYGARGPSVPMPPTNNWRMWPVLGAEKRGGPVADVGNLPRCPPPLRVPFPLDAAAAAARLSASNPAPTPAPPGELPRPLHAFFSDSAAAGLAANDVRHCDEQQPGTPTAAALGSLTAWDDEDDVDDDGVVVDGGGGTKPSVAGTPPARPLPLAPPPLPRRKPLLPLPPSRVAMPMMPSLSSMPPLPNAMMRMLQEGIQGPRRGPSPLLAACRAGSAATAALLLRRGALIDLQGGSELLGAAHPDVVDELLSAVPGLVVHLGGALLAAASANRADVVAALLRHGADPSFRGGAVLSEAAFKGHVEVLQLLLRIGGARLRGSGALAAALDLARAWGRAEAVRLLSSGPSS